MAYSTFNGWNIIPMPTSPAPRSTGFSMNDSIGQTQSPFTMQTQVQAWPGADWWEVEVSLPPMNRAKASAWVAWLMAMRGKQNVCMFGDLVSTYPRLGTNNAPLVMGAHLATATTLNTRAWSPATASRNLIADPDLVGNLWTDTSQLQIANGRGLAGTGNAWVYTGVGGNSFFQFVSSPAISVGPGAAYMLSGYVDATAVLSANVNWSVWDVNISTNYFTLNFAPGFSGRSAGSFIMPAGVTQVKIIANTTTATVKAGGQVIWSNPQFELGATTTAYTGTQTALMPGDFLQVGNRLHAVAGPYGVVPDGSGNASIEIWPSIREPLVDGQTVSLFSPQGLFRLADNKRTWSVNETKMYGISFKLMEAR